MKSQVGMYFPPLNNKLSLKKAPRAMPGVHKTVKNNLTILRHLSDGVGNDNRMSDA